MRDTSQPKAQYGATVHEQTWIAGWLCRHTNGVWMWAAVPHRKAGVENTEVSGARHPWLVSSSYQEDPPGLLIRHGHPLRDVARAARQHPRKGPWPQDKDSGLVKG